MAMIGEAPAYVGHWISMKSCTAQRFRSWCSLKRTAQQEAELITQTLFLLQLLGTNSGLGNEAAHAVAGAPPHCLTHLLRHSALGRCLLFAGTRQDRRGRPGLSGKQGDCVVQTRTQAVGR